ncbi:hypothetical protein MJ012_00940 [Acinetobacter baumannii]|jgi:hypothetical protein|uniref:hypothetical protein n=1 Tax=Acinetobacter calcoaceticus/baumannii complex TaxID=909768 RepID=UPI0002AEA46A|nr:MULTISPECIES: hypothetical protein [Acinetobacter calcoaceticus/baumannii complex]HEM7285169.1 hypothetical protein [Acinetobacter nosocomialis]ELX06507.1 hypothetical protein ACINNAV57_0860 [Acinetobacter baumannii Naval-57]EXB35411.1 hypothetical protein J518_0841 [Acinetobacter baumannii 1419130]EXH09897.1 hypothetical protein J627_3551 [Acinetobacter sp. 1245593]MBF6960718.1 hypothetical protein [Acinetobacter baumannii]
MRDDQIAELEKLQEMMTDDMLKIGFAAVDLGFESKEDRGDKVWLYKGFNQCSSAVAKISQIIGMKQGIIPPASTDEETQKKYEENLKNKAKAIIQSVKAKSNYS